VDGLARFVAVVMATILGLHVAESFDLRSRFESLLAGTAETVSKALREHDTAQLVPFRTTPDYMELFDGLTGRCYIYNPHQFAPDTADIDPDAIIASTVRRYESADFVSMRYLICVGDDYGVHNFVRFCVRLKKVHEQSRKKHLLEDKVRVGVLSDRAFSTQPTYHVQEKRMARSVIELRLSPLTVPDREIPSFYLMTTSADLRTRLQTHFDKTWPIAKEIHVRDLVRPEFQATESSVKALIRQDVAAV
jgi:hypothetical protein